MSSGDRGIVIDYRGEPRRQRRLGPLATAVLLAVPLLPFARLMQRRRGGIFLYVLSGQLFAEGFDQRHVGTVLDQPTIRKWLIVFTVFTGGILPYVAIVRWLSDRRTRAGYWCFAIPMIILSLYLIVVLTVPTWWLIQYVSALGYTPRRARGLAFCAGGYAVNLALLYWQLRPAEEGARAWI